MTKENPTQFYLSGGKEGKEVKKLQKYSKDYILHHGVL